jgi:DNA-directed RNA polymerase specialized sigma24 family protein
MCIHDNDLRQERMLLLALEKRNMKAFMELYKNYSEDLLIFAYSYLKDPKLAAKTVDEFFEDLWSTAKFSQVDPPIYKFLIEQIRAICEHK